MYSPLTKNDGLYIISCQNDNKHLTSYIQDSCVLDTFGNPLGYALLSCDGMIGAMVRWVVEYTHFCIKIIKFSKHDIL